MDHINVFQTIIHHPVSLDGLCIPPHSIILILLQQANCIATLTRNVRTGGRMACMGVAKGDLKPPEPE